MHVRLRQLYSFEIATLSKEAASILALSPLEESSPSLIVINTSRSTSTREGPPGEVCLWLDGVTARPSPPMVENYAPQGGLVFTDIQVAATWIKQALRPPPAKPS